MNGQLFDGLSKLKSVSLGQNICINEDFLTQSRIASLGKFVSSKCGFAEAPIARPQRGPSACDEKLKMHETVLNRTVLEKKALQTETKNLETIIATKSLTIATLEVKLSAAEEAKNKAEKNLAMIEKVYEALDAQRNQTFAATTEDLKNTLDRKLRENADLLETITIKNTEISNQQTKIKNLEEKIQIISNNNQW